MKRLRYGITFILTLLLTVGTIFPAMADGEVSPQDEINYDVIYNISIKGTTNSSITGIDSSPITESCTKVVSYPEGTEATFTVTTEKNYRLIESNFPSPEYSYTKTSGAGGTSIYTIHFTVNAERTVTVNVAVGLSSWVETYVGAQYYKKGIYNVDGSGLYIIQGNAYPDAYSDLVLDLNKASPEYNLLDEYVGLAANGGTPTFQSLYTDFRAGTKIQTAYDASEAGYYGRSAYRPRNIYPRWQVGNYPNALTGGSGFDSSVTIIDNTELNNTLFSEAKANKYYIYPMIRFNLVGTDGVDYDGTELGTVSISRPTHVRILPQLRLQNANDVYYHYDFTDGRVLAAEDMSFADTTLKYYDTVLEDYISASDFGTGSSGFVADGLVPTPSKETDVTELAAPGTATQTVTATYDSRIPFYNNDTTNNSATGTAKANIVQQATIATTVGGTEKPKDVQRDPGEAMDIMEDVKGWYQDYNSSTLTDLTNAVTNLTSGVQYEILETTGTVTDDGNGNLTGTNNSSALVKYTLSETGHDYENGDNIATSVTRRVIWNEPSQLTITKTTDDTKNAESGQFLFWLSKEVSGDYQPVAVAVADNTSLTSDSKTTTATWYALDENNEITQTRWDPQTYLWEIDSKYLVREDENADFDFASVNITNTDSTKISVTDNEDGRVEFTPKENGFDMTLAFSNTRKRASVTAEKELYRIDDAVESLYHNVTDDWLSYNVDMTYTLKMYDSLDALETDAPIKTLTGTMGGDLISFDNLYLNHTYYIKEAACSEPTTLWEMTGVDEDGNSFLTEVEGQDGVYSFNTTQSQNSITIKNVMKFTDVYLYKTVDGDGGDKTAKFSFTIDIMDENMKQIKTENTSLMDWASNDGSLTEENYYWNKHLPAHWNIRVTENIPASDRYTTRIVLDDETTVRQELNAITTGIISIEMPEGAIDSDGTPRTFRMIDFYNTRSSVPVTGGPNEVKNVAVLLLLCGTALSIVYVVRRKRKMQ